MCKGGARGDRNIVLAKDIWWDATFIKLSFSSLIIPRLHDVCHRHKLVAHIDGRAAANPGIIYAHITGPGVKRRREGRKVGRADFFCGGPSSHDWRGGGAPPA